MNIAGLYPTLRWRVASGYDGMMPLLLSVRPVVRRRLAGVGLLAVLVAATPFAQAPEGNDWPQWRGPLATGVAPSGNPPLSWSETENIRWKVPIPGHGSASPVVWGDHVFVLTAVPAGEGENTAGFFGRIRNRFMGTTGSDEVLHFVMVAINRRDGSVAWERTATTQQPHEGRHNTNSWASASAVADGEVACAFFGSRGLYCFDMDGTPLWDRDFGDMLIRLGFGEGASPVLHGDSIIVLWDHQGPSFITALDKRTGAERWRVDRDEETTWTTPIVVEQDGQVQVVTSATDRIRSYSAETGALLWEGEGVTENAIPSPVAGDGMVYLMSGYGGNRLYAVDLSRARGDITGSDAIAWSLDRDTPYVPSPVLHNGILYFTKSNRGILSAHDAATGRPLYGPVRLPGIREIYASPVVANGRLYITSRDGTTLVLATGPEMQVLATNMLDDVIDASAAVVGDEIYMRGDQFLYCIAAG